MNDTSKPLVIFGAGDIAALANYYFKNDSDRKVAAFTVDQAYLTTSEFQGLPVTPFEEIQKSHPPDQYDLFVAVSYSKMNLLRQQKCLDAKAKGYTLASYVSRKATIWANQPFGENCFILEDNTIQPFATIGNGVTLWSGNHVGHHSHIGDWCFISSHVVVSGGVQIEENCFIGVNATLRDHVKIARHCLIGAAALILQDTVEYGVYTGSPAVLSKVPSNRLKKI